MRFLLRVAQSFYFNVVIDQKGALNIFSWMEVELDNKDYLVLALLKDLGLHLSFECCLNGLQD
jgi:hypothetical protein